jgi:hypothetical protein
MISHPPQCPLFLIPSMLFPFLQRRSFSLLSLSLFLYRCFFLCLFFSIFSLLSLVFFSSTLMTTNGLIPQLYLITFLSNSSSYNLSTIHHKTVLPFPHPYPAAGTFRTVPHVPYCSPTQGSVL